MQLQSWYIILLSIIPVLFAITLHEVAHAWAAKRYGDNTAYSQGRITLNPMSHIDPIGTILMPLLGIIFSGFIFGWAKPVDVTFSRLKNIKKDGIKVLLAGPLANLLMAIIWSLILAICAAARHFINLPFLEGIFDMSFIGIKINVLLFTFNLLPIPPLDGGRILQLLLPPKYNQQMYFLETYGMYIVIALGLTGVLAYILNPLLAFLESFSLLPTTFLLMLLI